MSQKYSLLSDLRSDPAGYRRGDRELAEHFDDIEAAVAEGFSLRRCYDALRSAGAVTLSYSAFRRTVQRLRQAKRTDAAPSASSASEAGASARRAQHDDSSGAKPTGLRRAQWPLRRTPQE